MNVAHCVAHLRQQASVSSGMLAAVGIGSHSIPTPITAQRPDPSGKGAETRKSGHPLPPSSGKYTQSFPMPPPPPTPTPASSPFSPVATLGDARVHPFTLKVALSAPPLSRPGASPATLIVVSSARTQAGVVSYAYSGARSLKHQERVAWISP